MPKPKSYNITFVQGDTYNLRLRFKDANSDPVDITGWEFKAQVRANYDAELALAEFTYVIDDQVTNTGYVDLTLSDIQTTPLPVAVMPDPSGYWDLEITYPSGDVLTVMAGKVTVKAQVTRG